MSPDWFYTKETNTMEYRYDTQLLIAGKDLDRQARGLQG